MPPFARKKKKERSARCQGLIVTVDNCISHTAALFLCPFHLARARFSKRERERERERGEEEKKMFVHVRLRNAASSPTQAREIVTFVKTATQFAAVAAATQRFANARFLDNKRQRHFSIFLHEIILIPTGRAL